MQMDEVQASLCFFKSNREAKRKWINVFKMFFLNPHPRICLLILEREREGGTGSERENQR